MISVSQEVIDLINADSRTFRAKFKHGDSVYDKIMSLKWNVCLPSSSFSVGNALSIGIQCTAFDVPVSIKGEELELVITIEGGADEISIGYFTAEKPTIQNGIVSFNAYDDMSRAGNIPYNSTLGEGKHTVNQYVADVAETLGIGYISLGSEGEVTVENDYLSGNSCRNALAYLAGYLGRNCVIKNKKISMKKFTLVDYTMNADRIEEPELEDIDSEIDFIIAQISSNNTIMNGNGATGTELVCPIMTKSQLSNVANMLFGDASSVKTYRSGKVKLLLGDPRLELCDVIKLDYKDTEYIIPITSISFEYDGGLMTDLEAYALKEPTLLTPSQRLDFAVQEEVKKVLEQLKNIDGTYFYIRYSPNADGSNMTEEPDDKTEYIGVCSTNQSSAPSGASAYTWSKFKGTDGSSNFFHVKYSNDGGKTFTDHDGETAGEYIGILVDSNEDDSTKPSDYTWSKIVGNPGRGVSKVETEYRLSTSDTSLSEGYSWGTDAPTWQDGLFLWTRLATTYTDGDTEYSNPVVDASWKKTSVVDAASKELNETLSNALGLHVTEYLVGTSKIRYYHSNPSLTDSKSGDTILVFNAKGFGVCTTGWNEGDPDFQYGTEFEKGKAVWNILAANKISADLIEAGIIKSLDSAGVQTEINLNDGTITATAGKTKVTIHGGETSLVDEETSVETIPAGIALENETEGKHIFCTPSGFQFMTADYLSEHAKYLIQLAVDAIAGTNKAPSLKPKDPFFSTIAEQSVKSKELICQKLTVFDDDENSADLIEALSIMGQQVSSLAESIKALQQKYTELPYGGSKDWLESNGDREKLYQIGGYVWGYVESDGWTRSNTKFLIVSSTGQMTNAGGTPYLLRNGNQGTVYAYTEASGDADVPVYTVLPETANEGDIVAVGGRKYKASITTNQVPDYFNLANPLSSEWVKNSRISGSASGTGYVTTLDGYEVTNIIGEVKAGDVVRIQGMDLTSNNAKVCMCSGSDDVTPDADGVGTLSQLTMNATIISNTSEGASFNCEKDGFWRFSGVPNGSSEDVIITINEEIKTKNETFVTWNDIGAYIPPVETGWNATDEVYAVIDSLSASASSGSSAVYSTDGYVYTYIEGADWMQMSKYNAPTISIDEELSDSSTNAVQNRKVTEAINELNEKANTNANDITAINEKLADIETGSDNATIPSFWRSAVDEAIVKIKALQDGMNCVTFPFFSDNHQRNGYAGILISYIMKECGIPYCFFGGDTISSGYLTESEMIAQDKAFDSIMSYIPEGRFCRAVGNHDGYWNNNGNKGYYTRKRIYELFLRAEGVSQNKHFGADGTYYYVDDVASKVRFVVLNTNSEIITAGSESIDSTQLSWLQNTALSFDESGWGVVIISHCPISNHYHANVTNAEEVISAVNNSGADIIGWFSGHIHRDRMYIHLSKNGTDGVEGDNYSALDFTEVTITSDNTTIAYDDATKHTVANDDLSHAIDFVTINKDSRKVNITRLGIGDDRVYYY